MRSVYCAKVNLCEAWDRISLKQIALTISEKLSIIQVSFSFHRISSPIDEASADFDVLIFTQRWPITGCVQWMNEGAHNECTLPSQKDIWTIHGIWPTKYHSMGPEFCNRTTIFDIDTLKPLLAQLKQFWLNVEKGTAQLPN